VTRARAPRQVIISAIALARAVPPDFQMLRIVQVGKGGSHTPHQVNTR
jgi:hypothetical protein